MEDDFVKFFHSNEVIYDTISFKHMRKEEFE